MKFTILLAFFCCIVTLSLHAQTVYSVKGAASDTATKSKMLNTTISVLNEKDSTLVKFTRANAAGEFNIPNLKKGKFILLVTYPDYADYVERFTLDSVKTSHDFGRINMILKAKLLADVIIKGTRAAIKIKGDTTEFDPRAFKIQPNATVEDLLKQLPGVQVDKDGKITAQGQTVPKVLVDGEEFFGDDPTLVTKNLRADMVDKVQLFDKKSDQATFTGIDDGQKTKTINIQLKADKKNGYFGKAEAGGGTDGIYQSSLLFNRFKAKSKFSAYGIMGNNGKVGLGWDDSQKYGSSGNIEFGDDGGVSFFFNGSDDGLDTFGGQYNGQGLPLARTGGVHYDSKWNSDKQSINANYKIGSITVDGTENTLSQNNTPTGAINSTTDRNYHNYLFRQKLDGTYTIKLDTTSTLKITIDGTEKHGQTRSDYDYVSLRADGTKLNTNTRNVINNTNGKVFDANAFYTKKFKKKGRTFSWNLSEALNIADAHGNLKSDAEFYDPKGVVIPPPQITDQFKTSKTNSSVLTSNATYTEPLMKDFAIVFNYAISFNHGTSDQRSFNQSAPGVYNAQVDSLSNDYKLNEISNQVGAIFNYKTKKATLNFGTKISDVNYNQTNLFNGDVLKRDFVNWAPQASFQYRFSQQQSLYINYRGSATQPSITQIQPVINNTDNINTVTGNPDLRPSFTHNFNFFYYSYKVISGQSINFNGGYSFTNNPIISNVLTDTSRGKTFTHYQNLDSRTPFNYNLGTSFDKKIEKLDMNLGVRVRLNGSTSYSISNGDINRTIYDNYSGQLFISKYKEKKYEFYVSAGPNYTISNSSLLTNINNNGRGFRADGSFNIFLPAKFQIGSDVNYEFTAKTQTFDQDLKKTLVNAYLIKTFFKNDDLKLTLWGNDLLNQNVGFSRSVSGNFIQQNSYTTIKRYFMFSVTWNFNSMAIGTKK